MLYRNSVEVVELIDELANQEFEKKYEIVSIKAVDGVIHAKSKEKSLLPTEDWTKKEVSFF